MHPSGFFYVTGHGLSDAQIRRQYALALAIFDLPLEEKQKYTCDTASGDFRGYKPRSTGKLAARDTDERYNIAKFTPEHAHLSHPEIVQDHLAEIETFSRHIHDAILLPLLRIFAIALELEDKDFFVSRHAYDAPGLEYLRYMKYHPRSREADAEVANIWARGHTDYNTLTFLFHQPVAGLQVLTPAGETAPSKWRYVRSPREAIIVNVADALEFLSGGYLRSTVHRVVRPPEEQATQPRLSLIYFARPQADVRLKPVESPLLRRLGLQREGEGRGVDGVTAEGEFGMSLIECSIVLMRCGQSGREAVLQRTTDSGVVLLISLEVRLLLEWLRRSTIDVTGRGMLGCHGVQT